MAKKAFAKLSIEDIKKCPVWEFSSNGRLVTPILDLPVSNLSGRAVGVQVTIANGSSVWAILTNLSLEEPQYNPHLVSARLDVSGDWFDLGRYFDADYEDRTPTRFSEKLDLSVDEVFPISYDLSSIVAGTHESTCGQILARAEPELPLSKLMKFIVKKNSP